MQTQIRQLLDEQSDQTLHCNNIELFVLGNVTLSNF